MHTDAEVLRVKKEKSMGFSCYSVSKFMQSHDLALESAHSNFT